LRKALVRHLGVHPSTLEGHVLDVAASLAARCELAVKDPTVSHEDIARLFGAAARARSEFASAVKARQRDRIAQKRPPPPQRPASEIIAEFLP
jgi:hypothetical protein